MAEYYTRRRIDAAGKPALTIDDAFYDGSIGFRAGCFRELRQIVSGEHGRPNTKSRAISGGIYFDLI